MARLGRLIYTVQDSSGNAVSGISVKVHKRGATVEGAHAGAQTSFTVDSPGRITATSENVVVGTAVTVRSVASVSDTNVTVGGLGFSNVADGDRLLPTTNLPTLYSDAVADDTKSNPLTSSATGLVTAWVEYGYYDLFISGTGITTTLLEDVLVGAEELGQVRYAGSFTTGSSTNGIQEALDDLPSTGGKVIVGTGTFTNTAAIVLSNGQTVEGQGVSATIIKMGDSADLDVFITVNRATLTDQNKWTTGVDGVPHSFGVIALSIDGNKANNTSGNGISIYGKRYIIRDVMIYNCAEAGIFSEAGDTGGQTDQTDMPESNIGPVWIWSCGTDGIKYRGPHDGYISHASISSSTEDGVSLEFSSGVYNGACDIGYLHTYANRIGFTSAVNFNAQHLETESNNQEGAIIQGTTGNCSIGMFKAFKNSTNPTDTHYDLELDGTFNLIGNCWIRCDTSLGGISFDGVSNKVSNARIDGNNTDAIGIKVAANKTHFTGEIYDADAAGGIGVYTGNGGQTQNCIIEAHINNCDTAWENDNLGRRNIYTASIANVAGQTAVGGTQPLPDGNNDETWNIVALVNTTVTRSRNKGAATILNGTTSITVTHELIATPTAEDIQVTPNEDPVKRYWVDTVTATQFNINVDADPGADITFNWQAYI